MKIYAQKKLLKIQVKNKMNIMKNYFIHNFKYQSYYDYSLFLSILKLKFQFYIL